MVFTQGPSAHLRCLATTSTLGTISRSSDIVRFVQGGVVKTFRYVPQIMKALRVTIDGNTRTTADISRGTVGFVLSAGHHPDGEERPTYLSLGGLDDHNRLRWLDVHGLETGTCIKLELLDSDNVDEPERLPVDPDRVNRNDREQFEWAKETYFKLKDKFED